MNPTFLIFFLLPCLSISPSLSTSNSSSCPMDLGYVLRVPWHSSDCKTTHPQSNNSSSNSTTCCQTLLSLYGIALSNHLKETSQFQLQDLPTSISCVNDYQSKLNSLSLPYNLTSLCFDTFQFVITPNICASIQSKQDWVDKLGPTTALDTGCRQDLTDLTACDACVAAGFKVQRELTGIDGNTSHSTYCFYFTILYADGLVNEFGPESTGLSINPYVGSKSKMKSTLVFRLTRVFSAVVVMSFLMRMYFWWDRKWRKKGNRGFYIDCDELGSRPRMRPNTGSTILALLK